MSAITKDTTKSRGGVPGKGGDTGGNQGNNPGGDKGGNGGNGNPKGGYVPEVPVLSFPRETRKHDTPWLLIRANAGDVGNRPLPGGTVFWESPDVWVVSSLGINQPVPGQNNTVFARVTNLGMEPATGVFVKFWWANPSLAITETTAHLIGIGTTNIQGGGTVTVQCPNPWVPIVENNGHECLLAEAFIPTFDPLTSPMDPVDDRHVGQKNEQLVIASPGKMIQLHVDALNISGFALPLTFEVRPMLRQTVAPQLLTARTQLADVTIKAPAAALPVMLKVTDTASAFTGVSATFARRLLSATLLEERGAGTVCTTPPQMTHTAVFQAWEVKTLEVSARVPPDARPGQTFAFRIVQRIGNMVTGGYTVQVLVR